MQVPGGLNAACLGGGFNITTVPGILLAFRHDMGVLNQSENPAAIADPVYTWQDQSGQGHHATQGSPPKLQSGYLDFYDGSVSRYMSIATPPAPGQNNITVFLKASSGAANGSYGYIVEFTLGASAPTPFLSRPSNIIALYAMTDTTESNYGSAANSTELHTMVVDRSPTVTHQYWDGTLASTRTTGTISDVTEYSFKTIGRSTTDPTHPANNRIAAYVACSGILSDADRNAVLDWINT